MHRIFVCVYVDILGVTWNIEMDNSENGLLTSIYFWGYNWFFRVDVVVEVRRDSWGEGVKRKDTGFYPYPGGWARHVGLI